MAEEYFKDLSGSSQQQAQAVKAAQAGVQPSLELLRTQLHQLLHEVAHDKRLDTSNRHDKRLVHHSQPHA